MVKIGLPNCEVEVNYSQEVVTIDLELNACYLS